MHRNNSTGGHRLVTTTTTLSNLASLLSYSPTDVHSIQKGWTVVAFYTLCSFLEWSLTNAARILRVVGSGISKSWALPSWRVRCKRGPELKAPNYQQYILYVAVYTILATTIKTLRHHQLIEDRKVETTTCSSSAATRRLQAFI